MLQAKKKCPACEQWTNWKMQEGDTCEHCGHELLAVTTKEELENHMFNFNRGASFYIISEKDKGLVLLFKKLVNMFFFVYVSIMAFISWVIGTVAG
jgi:hypothetical protein